MAKYLHVRIFLPFGHNLVKIPLSFHIHFLYNENYAFLKQNMAQNNEQQCVKKYRVTLIRLPPAT